MARRGLSWISTSAMVTLVLTASTAIGQEDNADWLRKQLGVSAAAMTPGLPIFQLVSQTHGQTPGDLETLPPPKPITGVPDLGVAARYKLVELAAMSGDFTEPLKMACVGDNCPPMSPPPASCQERWLCMLDHYSEEWVLVCKDFKHMYCSWNTVALGAAIAIAAPLANTSADERVQHWMQAHAHGGAADHWASEGERFGRYAIVIPTVLVASLGGNLCPEKAVGACIGNWGDRATRALLVGAPTVVILQVALGTGSPGSAQGSAWHPGHGYEASAAEGFVGAVPFLAAASMTKIRPLRWALVGGSFIATWANLHQDRQFLSQALLGWSIAAVATCSVNQSEAIGNRVQFSPMAMPGGVGAGVRIDY